MNPSLLWLAAALFTWGIGEGMFYMFQPFYLSQLGANPVMIGYILGAAGFAMMIAHIPAGYLSDRIGRRPMLITAWLFGISATGIMALAPGLPTFVVGLLLYGFTAFVTSPLNSYVTAARGSWSVGRAITLTSATFNLGMVLGPFTGGWIGDHYGLRSVYYVAGILFIISTFFLIMIAPQPRDHHDPATPRPSLLTNRRYLGFIGLGFVVMLAMYLPQPFTAKFLQDVRGLSLERIGLLGTIGGIGNTALTFLLGFLDARLGFMLGQVGVGIYSGLIWQMNGYGWFAASYFLLGGFRAARSLYLAQIRPLVQESQMGLAFGISETVLGLTGIIGPIAAGFLYQQDKASVYPIALAAIIAGVFLSLVFAPRTTRDQIQPTLEIID
ncbi:MAG: MFS transporter [Chloroflexi bacterium]|nr:MFS transporter [Chloroflexota bacterium]